MAFYLLALMLAFILSAADSFAEHITPEKLRKNKKLISFSAGVAVSYIILNLFPEISSYALAFLTSLVMSYVLAHFVGYMQAKTVADGALLGFWLWIGFFATTQLGMVMWEGKPVKLYILNTLHYLATLVVMASILAVWA